MSGWELGLLITVAVAVAAGSVGLALLLICLPFMLIAAIVKESKR